MARRQRRKSRKGTAVMPGAKEIASTSLVFEPFLLVLLSIALICPTFRRGIYLLGVMYSGKWRRRKHYNSSHPELELSLFR